MFESLANSAFSQWMVTSKWAYPALLTLHGLGMAVLVGLTTMISLRVLGFPRQVPLAPYAKALPLGIGAFVINAISGTLLFVADAATLSQNPAFIFKIVSIVIGLFVLWRFYRGPIAGAVRQADAGGGEYVPTGKDKALAIVAMLLWAVAVIGSGRLIAYLAPDL
jgi:hypothetical protein